VVLRDRSSNREIDHVQDTDACCPRNIDARGERRLGRAQTQRRFRHFHRAQPCRDASSGRLCPGARFLVQRRGVERRLERSFPVLPGSDLYRPLLRAIVDHREWKRGAALPFAFHGSAPIVERIDVPCAPCPSGPIARPAVAPRSSRQLLSRQWNLRFRTRLGAPEAGTKPGWPHRSSRCRATVSCLKRIMRKLILASRRPP